MLLLTTGQQTIEEEVTRGLLLPSGEVTRVTASTDEGKNKNNTSCAWWSSTSNTLVQ